jgi:hypothetical protein
MRSLSCCDVRDYCGRRGGVETIRQERDLSVLRARDGGISLTEEVAIVLLDDGRIGRVGVPGCYTVAG